MRRRDMIIGSGMTLGFLAAGIHFWNGPQENVEPQMANALEEIIDKTSKNSEAKREHLAAAFANIERYGAVHVDNNGAAHALSETFDANGSSEFPLLAVSKTNSQYLDSFYSQMHPDHVNVIKENVKYFIFVQNPKRDLGFMKEHVAGVSLGNGAVLIDSGLNPIKMPSVQRHEASHGRNKGKLHTLDSEANATAVEIDVLEFQFAKEQNEYNKFILSGMLENAREIQATANYLKRFGDTFRQIYPRNVVLSRDVLAARINPNDLEKAVAAAQRDYHIADEMRSAATIAQLALTMDREKSIRHFYSLIKNSSSSGLDKINAIFSLGYLAKDAMRLETSSSSHPRGARVSINETWMVDLAYDKEDLIQDPNWKLRMEAHEEYVKQEERRQRASGSKTSDMYPVPTRTSRFIAYGDLPPIDYILQNN